MIRLSDVYIRNVYKTVIEHVWYFLLVLFSCQRETRTGISGFSDSGAGWIWLIFPVPNSIFCLEERYRTLPIFCNWKFFLCFSYQRDHASLFPMLEKPEGLSRQKTGRVRYYSPDRKISDTEAGKLNDIRLLKIRESWNSSKVSLIAENSRTVLKNINVW